jgi:hypothetical protein
MGKPKDLKSMLKEKYLPQPDAIETQAELNIDEPEKKQKHSVNIMRKSAHTYRRAFSETQLLDILPLNMKVGESYHIISAGDVDSLSFLKIILRQQNLDYLLLSTWCMAKEDIYQIQDWLENGNIKICDAYVGEIFPGTYKSEFALLKPIIEKFGGRVCVFRNHSKIYAGYGEKFHFGIETSANINTNPRTENGCITIDEGLYRFYRNYFDGITSFE